MHQITRTILVIACGILMMAGSPAEADAAEQRIEKPVRQSIDTRRVTQKEEEQWRLEREAQVVRLEQLQQQRKQLVEQKKELDRQVESARSRISAKEKKLADIMEISIRIPPFVDKIFNALKTQVAGDTPFLSDERRMRITRLETLMIDPDVDISEKYRKVMEALLVEAEYGFTIEAYQETITVDGQAMLADIFRLGRVNLFYQSLDRKQSGYYDAADGGWKNLEASHNPAIRTAIDIAAKRRPIEMLNLPVGRMVIQ